MPEVEHSVDVAAPVAAVWAFVSEIDNWAPLVAGYQRHAKEGAHDSVWHLKGELGGLTRIAEFRVRVTRWEGPERVDFELAGLDEPVTGEGSFTATPFGDSEPAPALPRSLLARLWRAVVRRLFGLAAGQDAPAATGGATATTRITFRLALHGGGRTGPLLMLLVAPMLQPVAEDLATRIARRITELQAPG